MDRNEKGIAAIEYIFIVAVSIVLIFGALELARAAMLKHALGIGAWTAARHLSLNPWDETTAENLARQAIAGSIMGGNPGAATVTFIFASGARSFGSEIAVRVEMGYQALVPLMNLAPRTMVGESVILVEAWP
jgi:Flp pilus assembly protein TadG